MPIRDDVVGAMALDIAKRRTSELAVRLLREASAVLEASRNGYGGRTQFGLTLVLPLDFMDLLNEEAARAICEAARRAGIEYSHEFVEEQLAPAAPGWRDRLAELEDWGSDSQLGNEWAVINERVHELRNLFHRSITPDDRADVGRRCRELLIAATSATFRPGMVPEGETVPKDSDAKAKARYIIASLGSNSVDERLAKLVDRAWDLAAGLLHYDEPSVIATYGAAQSAILIVRTLAVAESEIQARNA